MRGLFDDHTRSAFGVPGWRAVALALCHAKPWFCRRRLRVYRLADAAEALWREGMRRLLSI